MTRAIDVAITPMRSDTRAPSRTALQQMSVNRIIRTMDFGTMMSVTYMLDRDDRETVARWLGVEGDDRAPPPEAYCEDRSVAVPAFASRHWNGWSPSPRMEPSARFATSPAR